MDLYTQVQRRCFFLSESPDLQTVFVFVPVAAVVAVVVIVIVSHALLLAKYLINARVIKACSTVVVVVAVGVFLS